MREKIERPDHGDWLDKEKVQGASGRMRKVRMKRKFLLTVSVAIVKLETRECYGKSGQERPVSMWQREKV